MANGPEDPGLDAFDCSGLTQWAYQEAGGPTLPHLAEGQRVSSLVNFFSDISHAQRGDLVFMNFPNGRGIYPPHASHVGLFSSHATSKTPATMLDTRNPNGEPVAIRTIELGNVLGFGRVNG
jgi:cell wall-associated NlpC family hydrolase